MRTCTQIAYCKTKADEQSADEDNACRPSAWPHDSGSVRRDKAGRETLMEASVFVFDASTFTLEPQSKEIRSCGYTSSARSQFCCRSLTRTKREALIAVMYTYFLHARRNTPTPSAKNADQTAED